MSEALWITEGEVVSLLALPEAIEALRWGLGEEAAGRASNMTKTQLTWGGGSTLHAIGALFESGPIVGTKTWTHTKGGANHSGKDRLHDRLPTGGQKHKITSKAVSNSGFACWLPVSGGTRLGGWLRWVRRRQLQHRGV